MMRRLGKLGLKLGTAIFLKTVGLFVLQLCY